MSGQQTLGQCGKLLLAFSRINRFVHAEIAAEYAVDIAIHHCQGQPVGKRANGSGGIVPHSFQRSHACIIGGEMPLRDNLTCRCMKVACAAIIAQPLPQPEHFVFRSQGQGLHCGESIHKAQIVIVALRHPCLLQNNLRHPNAVGIGDIPPRQLAPVRRIPMQNGLCKGHLLSGI